MNIEKYTIALHKMIIDIHVVNGVTFYEFINDNSLSVLYFGDNLTDGMKFYSKVMKKLSK